MRISQAKRNIKEQNKKNALLAAKFEQTEKPAKLQESLKFETKPAEKKPRVVCGNDGIEDIMEPANMTLTKAIGDTKLSIERTLNDLSTDKKRESYIYWLRSFTMGIQSALYLKK